MRKTKQRGVSCCGLSWCLDPYKANSSSSKASSSPHQPCRRFALAEIQKASNNFHGDCIVGKAGFGIVYRGCIDGGNTMVAIRRLTPGSHDGARGFKNEIELLSQLRHPHLISLIGYCNEKNERILVYDYMIKGDLLNHLLYKTEKGGLPWKQRLEICIGAAKGLHYLHTGGKRTIIHRDVKSSNILLDEKWAAKISDFGSSLMGPSGMPNTPVSSLVMGTPGYLDPEYMRLEELTEKSDVYSFGVVLFEVLCARSAVNPKFDEDEMYLSIWAKKCIRNGTIDEIIDPYLTGKIAPVCLKEFVAIAESCLRDNGIERPMMGDVVEGLEFARQLQESADAVNEETDSGDEFSQ